MHTVDRINYYIEIENTLKLHFDTYIWHIHSFLLSLIKPKLIYTMRVNDRKLSEGEMKFYTSKYGRPPTGRRAKLRD